MNQEGNSENVDSLIMALESVLSRLKNKSPDDHINWEYREQTYPWQKIDPETNQILYEAGRHRVIQTVIFLTKGVELCETA